MAALLSATHLLRRFALFALTLLFLLTASRAGYALWHQEVLTGGNDALRLFVNGLRVDLALVGLLSLPAIVVAPLLGALRGGRGTARALVTGSLTLAVMAVLLAEYITPGILQFAGVRPDTQVLAAMQDASAATLSGLRAAPLPALLGALLIALVMIAFIARLDSRRLLAHPLSTGSATAVALLGGAACLLAVWSGATGPGMPMADGGVSPAAVGGASPSVDELALNTAWKMLYGPVVEPVLSLISSDPIR